MSPVVARLCHRDLTVLCGRQAECPPGCHRWIALTPVIKRIWKFVSSDHFWLHFAFPHNIHINAYMTCAIFMHCLQICFIVQWLWAQSKVTPNKVPLSIPGAPWTGSMMLLSQSCQRQFSINRPVHDFTLLLLWTLMMKKGGERLEDKDERWAKIPFHGSSRNFNWTGRLLHC